MYVVKVGEFYIKSVEVAFGGAVGDIVLSKEIQRTFTKEGAERMAKLVGGTVIEMAEVVTND